ncbi:hypothetical protein ABN034_28920 [Actinopolymorpha sp. B11F2]
MRAAIRDALLRDDRVFLVGEDIGRYGGCFGALDEDAGPVDIDNAAIRRPGIDVTRSPTAACCPRRSRPQTNWHTTGSMLRSLTCVRSDRSTTPPSSTPYAVPTGS